MVLTNDMINGMFILFGGGLCWMNVRQLIKDKRIAGVRLDVSAFFAAWGLWNLYYYPALQQWVSFSGEVVLVGGNLAWFILALFYKIKETHDKSR